MLAYSGSRLYTEGAEDVADTATPKQVIVYADAQGKEPFTLWLNGLRDRIGRQRILARVVRLAQGNYRDHAPVGEGVSELRLFFGPGYRVYFGEHGGTVVVLLCGGDKDSQPQDIQQAQTYWREYKQLENLSHDRGGGGRLPPQSS